MTEASIHSEKGVDLNAYEEPSSGKTEPVRISLRQGSQIRSHKMKEAGIAIFMHDICCELFSLATDHGPFILWYNMMIKTCPEEAPQRMIFWAPPIAETLLYKPKALEQGYQVFLSRVKSPSDHIALTNDLSVLLSLKDLAPELRLRIWEFLDETSWTGKILSSLSRVPEIKYLQDRHAYGPSSQIQLGEFKLSSYNCENLGISRLSCVHIESTGASTCTGEIDVKVQVSTIEVAHGYFGLSAVRFFIGQEKSDWLGVLDPLPQHRWHRYIRNETQSDTIHFRGEVWISSIN
jgi:hypothetical protein